MQVDNDVTGADDDVIDDVIDDVDDEENEIHEDSPGGDSNSQPMTSLRKTINRRRRRKEKPPPQPVTDVIITSSYDVTEHVSLD